MKAVYLSGVKTMTNYERTKELTPWSRVPEKLTGPQLVKKFSAFNGRIRRFITAPVPIPTDSNPVHAPIQLPQNQF